MGTIHFSSVAAAAMLSATLAGAPAEASLPDDDEGGYYAYADVLEVSPRYGWHEVDEPVLQCVEPLGARHGRSADRYPGHDERRDRRGRHSPGEGAAGLVGGLIGGLIGHQFGGGNGKTALTIAGAALGASMARDQVRRERWRSAGGSYQPSRYDRSPRHCTETYRTRRVRGVNGYDVTYRYQGATFHKWVDEHPGDVIRVHVAVEPVTAP